MPSTTPLDGESTPTNTALNPICPTFPLTTSVVAPSHASTTTATRSRRLPPGAVHWPNLGDSLKCQVKRGLTKAYQSILELQAEGLIHLSMTKSMDAAAIAHIEAHHKDVTASLQAVVADTLSHTNATVDNTIVTLQTEYDAQRRVVFDEINAHKLTTDLALKRTRVAMAKETHRFTSLETCLRRDEMHVLESQHQARIQSLRDEMAAKDAAYVHVDILLRQKSAFVDIERFSQKLQTALDDALLEVERVKKLDHQRYTNNTAVSTISESYVTSLRHAVAAANEHTEQMRVELEQQTKANETLERVKVALDDSVGRLTHELKTARDLLAESARELISLQEVQATTAKDLAGCRVTIQDFKNRADKLTNELNAQTDLVLTCDDCVADLKTQLESHTKHVERITAEHALAREVWAAEAAQLRDSRASDAATIDKLYGKLALLGYDKDMLDMYASPSSVTTSPISPTGASLPPTGAAPTIHVATGRPPMTSIVAVGRRCQGVTASRDHYDGLVQVLQREQIDLADDKAQRLFDLEASIRASVTSQLTYEFKRTFSKQLRQRMQQERFFLMEKIDSIVAMAAVEERAAKRLLAKQAKAVGRRVSLRGVPETTMTLRKVKATITQAYDAMGVIEWNGEDVAEMKREVAALTKDNADLAAAVADLESKVEIQLLSLAEAELFQKERDMLLVELTKKFNAVTGEVATLKQENKAYDGGDSGSNNQHHVDEATYNMPLSVQGHFPHMDRRPVKSTTSTCTMGNDGSNAHGIIPTAVRALFDKTSLDTSNHVEFGVTLVEVYGEEMRHLLSPTLARLTRASDCCVYEERISSAKDCLGLLQKGTLSRKTGKPSMNAASSRARNLSETLNSLGYASRARRIVNKLTVNQTNDLQVARLRAQIELFTRERDGLQLRVERLERDDRPAALRHTKLSTHMLKVLALGLTLLVGVQAQPGQGNLPADVDFPRPWADIDADEYMKGLKERIEKFKKQRQEDDGNL
ncbi:hypothetical protein DYB37_002543 [Aphanomyces astaci]|uniref:Kinesin motor domain-containing protein n=1 Tax=Aphanomyces astaci TaxID=112090 RepID=A0A3R6XVH1_APHAT|nr:hypothetical protein DYB35_000396 [Aphanomyces astaci]RHZ24482.1 hypothetical protein DYB37_002543 [Aphanomyces astaci]